MTVANHTIAGVADAETGHLDPSIGDGPAVEVDARLRRIDDYLQEALAKENPLEANLGVVNGDLMRIAHGLNLTLVNAMAGPVAVEDMPRLMPALDSYLRTLKQIERYAQLDRRLVTAREKGLVPPGPGAPPGLKLTPLPDARRGEDWPF